MVLANIPLKLNTEQFRTFHKLHFPELVFERSLSVFGPKTFKAIPPTGISNIDVKVNHFV
jgi:hypothetical protein